MGNLIGQSLGRYHILEQLGMGGMAVVYKAYHPELDRHVALKVMHAELSSDPNFLLRFQREARVAARLDHPNIVPVFDFAEQQGLAYLVMKLISGETLKERISRGSPSPQETLHILQAIGAALEYAHRQGVVHRDIKPSNILIDSEGVFYLADFGLARMVQSKPSTMSSEMLLGTPHYISPEQAQSVRDLDKRSDIYSLGVVMYEMVVGRLPFLDGTSYSILYDHIRTPLPKPRELNPKVSEAVEKTLVKALSKERSQRYQEVSAFVHEYEKAISQTESKGSVLPKDSEERDRADSIRTNPPDRVSVSTVLLEIPPSAPDGQFKNEKIFAPPADSPNRNLIAVAGLLLPDGSRIPLCSTRTCIGRTSKQDVDLSRWDMEKFVSKEHAEILAREKRWFLRVLPGTRNPTRVNDAKILEGEEAELKDGDEVQFAKVRLIFRVGTPDE